LVGVRLGEGVWLPERHDSIFADGPVQSPLSGRMGTLDSL
jgi:hypothetical protein